MNKEQTLSRRFTTSSNIVLTVLLVAVFTLVFFSNLRDVTTLIRQQEDAIRKDYASKGELLGNLTSKITPEAVMGGDMYSLKTIATQLLADEDVIKVEFLDPTGKQLVVEEEKANSDSLIVVDREIITDAAKLGIEQKVGTLRISIDQFKLLGKKIEFKKLLMEKSLRMVFGFAFLTIVLNLLIAITINKILKKVVITPIRRGIDLVTAVAEQGDLSINVAEQFESVEQSYEITLLANAMKKLVDAEKDIVKVTTAMADGVWNELPKARSSSDELSNSLRGMIEHVSETLLSVRQMATQVSDVSQNLSDSGQDLAMGASDQAMNISQVIGAMATLSQETKVSAEKAAGARHYSETVNRNAVTGNRQMEELNSAMEDIKRSSDAIKKIIKTIDDIAFQTNLLALNAAVEAARAGQHGKGFAVVADEVRSLASRSAKAAQETADLIENSNLKVQNGITIAVQTGASLKEIVGGVDKINTSLEEISNAALSQVEGLQGVSGKIGTIENVTQRTATTAQETAAMAEELSAQAQMLNELLSHFELGDSDRPQMEPIQSSAPRLRQGEQKYLS